MKNLLIAVLGLFCMTSYAQQASCEKKAECTKQVCCEKKAECKKQACCEKKAECKKQACCEKKAECKKQPCCEKKAECKKQACCEKKAECKKQAKCELEHPCFAYNATIYELNTRQLTKEGTFKAAEAVLPALKELGVDIIWIMPIQKIGELERKGSLGSYYAITDYCQFNPEFGTRADFEHFLGEAHKLGLKVILDWVANHTAPDSEWTKNEGWHYRDSLGNLMVQYDWTDISKLNYENQDMRAAMKQAMHWWMDSIGIDGFRCDVAGEVPTDFWNDVMAELRVKHPKMFTLAEDEAKAQELTATAFDMYYGWELHHLMNSVAQGKKTVQDLWDYFAKVDQNIRPKAIRMNFTSNHDENSWNGTEFERMGDASNLFAAFTYIAPGMPMIYTGQPSGNHHRLAFFEKDLIDRVEGAPQKEMYTKLNELREKNFALWSNEIGAPMLRLETNNDKIFACVRSAVCKKSDKENTVIAIMNMSDKAQTVTVNIGDHAGSYNCMCGKTCKIKKTLKLKMKPWQHMILTK